MAKLEDIMAYLEKKAPVFLAEEWDNTGLLVGEGNKNINKVLISLDVTSTVLDEAVDIGADLIISHHPLVFNSVKTVTDRDIKGKMLLRIIRNGISVYVMHTNYDAAFGGTNDLLAGALGLANVRGLNSYHSQTVYKIAVFVPVEALDKVRAAMTDAGAGFIGNYKDCTYSVKGTGTFRPLEGTNPYIGKTGKLEKVDEYRLESVISEDRLSQLIIAMRDAHPYEEPAYDVFRLETGGENWWLGRIGELERKMNTNEFISHVKRVLKPGSIQVAASSGKTVRKVAVFCGAFDGDLSGIKRERPDALITGEVKYHTARDMIESGMVVVNAGHYNTEKFMERAVADMLCNRFEKIDVICSETSEDVFKIY